MAAPVYPVFLHLARQPVLIVGGGKVALRKARGLVEAQAVITVVSPAFVVEFEQLPQVALRREKYGSACMSGPEAPHWRLVFAATDDPVVNREVAEDARARNIFCCRCDASDEGDFSNASVWRREQVVVAVGTGGAAPLLAAKIAQKLGQALDPAFVELGTLMDSWRAIVAADIADPEARARLLRELVGDEMLHTLQRGGTVEAEKLFQAYLAASKADWRNAEEKRAAAD